MRLLQLIPTLLLAGAAAAKTPPAWNFDEAIISVQSKSGNPFKDKLSDHVPLSKAVTMGATDNLKIILTATEAGTAKRPHQAFLMLRDQDTGLETTFPFSMKESGKGKVDFTQKDLPVQLLTSSQPLRATLLLASFGPSQPFSNHVFNLDIKTDPNAAPPKYEKPERYGKLPEINHIFKADPKNPPVAISWFFMVATFIPLSMLFGTWSYLDANLDQLGKAMSTAPISHALFFGSIVSMEGIFVLYYYSWSLFQMLPIAGVVGLVAFYSGSKALSEVQARRMAGER